MATGASAGFAARDAVADACGEEQDPSATAHSMMFIGDIDEEDLIAWSRERLANFKVPRRVRVISELPRNASGKVLKYKLREMAHA